MTDPDVELMERVKAGDLAAFQELVETHQARVIGTVAKMLGDERDAEDVAQAVFLRVWNSAARYQPSAKFTTWLFTITKNLVFNELRRRKRHHLVPLESASGVRSSASAPDTELANSELQTAIQQAIDSLPITPRMAVILRRYEDLPYEEIAQVLGLTVPAVKRFSSVPGRSSGKSSRHSFGTRCRSAVPGGRSSR